MILSKREAYELGNALLDAVSNNESSKTDDRNFLSCICKMDTGELFAVQCNTINNENDCCNGFKTIAIITK